MIDQNGKKSLGKEVSQSIQDVAGEWYICHHHLGYCLLAYEHNRLHVTQKLKKKSII